MPRAIGLHQLDHVLIEELTILLVMHVDEVYGDDATHISESELASQLFGCDKVHIDSRTLLLVILPRPITTIDVYDVHGFGLLDDEIGTALAGDGTSKGGLDLLRHPLLVEDG